MCNLYSNTSTVDEARRVFRVIHARVNMEPRPALFPDQLAPVVRVGTAGERELLGMRWGFPPPPNAKARHVTNIRNPSSAWWRPWLDPAYRCLVPATSFCEYTDSLPKVPHWFALSHDRPAFAFAGLWRPWTGVRGTKKDPGEGDHLLFAFLTTEPNDVVRPVHAKAMPVMLTTPEECDRWLNAPSKEALDLQRPLPADRLHVVATGVRSDEPPAS